MKVAIDNKADEQLVGVKALQARRLATTGVEAQKFVGVSVEFFRSV
jgi:hypothetical protein